MNNWTRATSIFISLILLPLILVAQSVDEEITRSRETALIQAIRRVSPAVAGINVVKLQKGPSAYRSLFDDPFWSYMFPETYRRVESLGSGLVISSDGYVVTNAHVVENAAEIIITLPGGEQYEVEENFTDALTDIALLKIDARDLPAARLGDSDKLMIGQWVVALGNPLGLFDVGKQPTATAGIVSGLHMNFGHKRPGRVYQEMIQTDASINPGNSGGPLVDAGGDVIGINSFIFTENEYSGGSIGIGFAIPINRVKEVVEELKTKGRVDRSFDTGLGGRPLDRYSRNYLGISHTRGFIITRVDNRSPGDRAGLKPGDVILEVNGRIVSTKRDILSVIEEDLLRAGDALNLLIWREGKEISVSLELGRSG
ncbi:MAG: trypsin-like peptidase domain-containing protein [Fidelibacterota bacterium]|nr:MAG: trypsin-like peptidase domain-containing protein [Candidatus Neomarinimicrobiota bacterium]